MKRLFRELLIIPIYFVLLLFKNMEFICTLGREAFGNLDLVNWPLTIGVVIFSIILLFYDELKKYKKTIFSTAFVVLACMLMQGFFAEKQIYRYIILYVVLIYNSMLFSKLTKQRFEVAIVGSNAILLFVLFWLGLFNLLNISMYILAALEGILTIFAIILTCKNKNSTSKDLGFNSWNIVVFSIFFVMFILGGIDRYVSVWDEYSHWGYDAKAVITYEKYTTCPESLSATRSYPPYISLWHFFISKIMGGFEEGNLFTGLSLFILVCLTPALSFINKKNRFLLPFYSIVIMFGATLFSSGYGYTSLYADYAQAAAIATCLMFYYIYKDEDIKLRNRMLFLSLSIMLMIRPTGIIAAFVFFLIFMLKDYIELCDYKFTFKSFFKKAFKVLKKWLLLGISIVALYMVWNIYLRICSATIPEYYDAHIISDGLKTDISSKLNSYVIGRTAYYFIKFFDNKEMLDFTVTQFSLLLVLFAFCMLCLKQKKDSNTKIDLKTNFMKMVPFIVGWVVFLLLNVFAMFVKFPAFEIQTLPGLLRYMDGFNVAIFIMLMALAVSKEFTFNKRNMLFSVISILVIFSQIKLLNVTYFATDLQSRKASQDVSYQRQDKLALINEHTPEDSKVYIMDQQDTDGIMALWYARYYTLPRKINAYQRAISWKIRTEKNIDDLQDWGLTAMDLSDDLLEYGFDYIFFYTSDDSMFEQMSFMFEDVEDSKNYTLFKIEEKDNHALLVPVA